MSMLERYKKGNNILELVKLVEDSTPAKKEQLLNMIQKEDPEFCARVESRIFTYEKFKELPEGVQAEVIARTPAKYMAYILSAEKEDYVKFAERCLGNGYNAYKEERDALKEKGPQGARVEAAQRKLISEARKLEASGAIKLPKPATETTNVTVAIEDLSPSEALLAQAETEEKNGTAKAEMPCPPLSTFGLSEAPPPGMIGERFETYIRNTLKAARAKS